MTPVVVRARQHCDLGAFAATAERLVGHAPGDAPGAAAARVAAPARGGARGGRVNGGPDAFQRRRGGRARPRVRGAAGAARTSGARRPSRRRERRTISRRSFLPRASRAPVSASLARTRAAGRVPSRPREFLLLVIQLLTHQFRSTRPCPPRTIRLAPVSCRPRRAAPQIFGSKCNKSGRRRSAPR